MIASFSQDLSSPLFTSVVVPLRSRGQRSLLHEQDLFKFIPDIR